MPTVLVLGRGLVGNAVSNHLKLDTSFEVETLGRSALDLRNPLELAAELDRIRPEIVIIAAGVVGGIEKNIAEPYLLGSENNSEHN
jgi:GDP-L-fucose synthase